MGGMINSPKTKPKRRGGGKQRQKKSATNTRQFFFLPTLFGHDARERWHSCRDAIISREGCPRTTLRSGYRAEEISRKGKICHEKLTHLHRGIVELVVHLLGEESARSDLVLGRLATLQSQVDQGCRCWKMVHDDDGGGDFIFAKKCPTR